MHYIYIYISYYSIRIWMIMKLEIVKYPLRTAVASATVAGMMKKELADTASWKRLM